MLDWFTVSIENNPDFSVPPICQFGWYGTYFILPTLCFRNKEWTMFYTRYLVLSYLLRPLILNIHTRKTPYGPLLLGRLSGDKIYLSNELENKCFWPFLNLIVWFFNSLKQWQYKYFGDSHMAIVTMAYIRRQTMSLQWG